MNLYPLLKVVAPRLARKYAQNYMHGFRVGYPLVHETLPDLPRRVTRSFAYGQGLRQGKATFKASGSPRLDYYA